MRTPVEIVADLVEMTPEEVEIHEAILSGLREEGVLTGTRREWKFDPRGRGPSKAEAEALAYITILSMGLEAHGMEMKWEALT